VARPGFSARCLVLAVLAGLVFPGLPFSAGCGPRQSPLRSAGLSRDVHPGFESFLRDSGLGHWRPVSEPQTGEGLEGLAGLINGAAEALWTQGAYKAVFQEFSVGGGETPLEFQRYFFRSAEQARRYHREVCGGAQTLSCPSGSGRIRKENRESPREEAPARASSEGGDAEFCVLVGEYVSQGLVRVAGVVTEMRAYAGKQTAAPLLDLLVRGLGGGGDEQLLPTGRD